MLSFNLGREGRRRERNEKWKHQIRDLKIEGNKQGKGKEVDDLNEE